MHTQTAGSMIQTSSGRLLFAGKAGHHNSVCLWYSDDHGSTYRTTEIMRGNEVSIAELQPGHLIMNGRGLAFDWKPSRATYYSKDDGMFWSSPQPSTLRDNNKFGCEAALISVPKGQAIPTLYFSEPVN